MTQSIDAVMLQVFRRALGLPEGIEPASIRRDDLAAWDSVGHMHLVSELEATFGVHLGFEEVLGLDSFDRAVEFVTREEA